MASTPSLPSDPESLSVALIGAGAVGSYYGARLWQAGHRVQFYLRPSLAFDVVQEKGLQIYSTEGDFCVPPNDLALFDDPAKMDQNPDWIIICLKSTALSAIPELILPLLSSEHTRVLVIMNGFVEDDLIKLLREATGQSTDGDPETPLECCRTLYGGLAFIAANRDSPGQIQHILGGPIAAGVASSQVSHQVARDELMQLWQPVKSTPCSWEDSLLKGRWRKMLWNLPFNGLCVATSRPVDAICTDPSLRKLATLIMEESRTIANADIGTTEEALTEEALTVADMEHMWHLSDSVGAYQPSTLIDLLEKRPMEVEHLFRKPVERARTLGIPCPHLEAIVALIAALQRQYDLY
jgi:2-dehydropantoate 2-reductase